MADIRAAAAAAPAREAPGASRGKDATATAGKAAATAKPANRKPMLLIVGVLLLLAAAGAGAYFFLGRSGDTQSASADTAKTKGDKGKDKGKEKKEEAKKPYFVEFETFTVNLKDPEKFLQIKLTFQVKSVEAAEAIKDLMPIIRSAVIPVLSAQDPSDLMAKEGKEKLSSEVVAAANKAVAGTAANDSVDAVLITHMLIQ